MQPISNSKTQKTPSVINHIIFDFAGSHNFYAINWVCRNWQNDLTEEKVFKIAIDLFSTFSGKSMEQTRSIFRSFTEVLSNKNRKDGILKLMSLNLVDNEPINFTTFFHNKIYISIDQNIFSPTESQVFSLNLVFAYENHKDEFYFDFMTDKVLRTVIRDSDQLFVIPSNMVIKNRHHFEWFEITGTPFCQMEFEEHDNFAFNKKMLNYIGSLITPEFNRTPEPITSFKDFFADRVFRINHQPLI